MRKVWVVVANSSQAKIYRAENVHNLVEHATFFCEETRQAVHDLVSDKQGQEGNRMGGGQETYQPKTPVKVKEACYFADTISQFLEKGWTHGEFERVYLIAKAPFLGWLREALSPHITKVVQGEIAKDLILLAPKELRDYLPPVL